jgi:HEAT repeat protein
VSNGLATTLRLLTQTKNEAAVGILIPALDCAHEAIQDGALQSLLERRSEAGQKEVVRRLHTINERWVAIIEANHGLMSHALRDAVLAIQPQLCANGCQAALWFREFDLIPALINAAEDEANPNRELVAATLLRLTETLYDELAAPRDYRNRRDPQLVRRHVVGSLEESVKRYPKHKVTAVIEAFLLLAHRDNAALKQILTDPLNPSYLPIIQVLTHSERGGVIRLVLSFLDDPSASSSAITLLAHRSDPRFIECLARKIGAEPSAAAATNLKKIENIAWLQAEPTILDKLDDAAQFGALQLALRSGTSRRVVLRMVEHLLQKGRPGGRQAASAALAQFNGAEANALCLQAVADADPVVQANALRQLRQRGIPGALTRLVEMLESPHEVVRSAVREGLSEFNFKRYLAAFDMLEEDVRVSTGVMVRKIDREAIPQLQEELLTKSRTRRLRAIAAAVAMGAVPSLEQALLDRLADEDHLVRAETARALVWCKSPAVRQALVAACGDRSVIVQEAAEESLRFLKQAPAEYTSPQPQESPQ